MPRQREEDTMRSPLGKRIASTCALRGIAIVRTAKELDVSTDYLFGMADEDSAPTSPKRKRSVA